MQEHFQLPCVRPSLLSGIGSGMVVGLLVYLKKGKISQSSNAAVGTFVVVSAIGIPLCLAYRRSSKQVRQTESIITGNE